MHDGKTCTRRQEKQEEGKEGRWRRRQQQPSQVATTSGCERGRERESVYESLPLFIRIRSERLPEIAKRERMMTIMTVMMHVLMTTLMTIMAMMMMTRGRERGGRRRGLRVKTVCLKGAVVSQLLSAQDNPD